MSQKLLLYLRYDGSRFCGYQTQKNGYSVQQALNEGTEALFGYPCDITGCSRTDSGVHANMFCATVTPKGGDSMETSIPLDRLPRALNIRLPDALAAYKALWVPGDFHARYSVSSKEYVYRILCTPDRDPFEHGRAWHYPRPLSPDALTVMRRAAAGFVGQRDFAACMASGSKVQSTVRHVMSTSVEMAPAGEGRLITFRVRADGFLYNMVRIMVGTVMEAAEGHIPPESIPERLDSLDRSRLGRTAPAEGLYLTRVFYNDPEKEGYHG
jgi:tRNA pseudouridine38-40 synthase